MFLIDKLQSKSSLTSNEERIADYILINIDKIPQTTMEELAQNTYTSHSAIVRFAKKMGYDGFKEFKQAISEIVHQRLHQIDSVNPNFPFEPGDNPTVIAKKMATLTTETIQRTLAQLDFKVLDQIAARLLTANRIFIFAQGDTQIRGRSFQNKLMKLNKFLIIAEEYADEDWIAANVLPNDCVLFLTYSGRIKQYQRFLEHFKQNNISTILISGNPHSELVGLADVTQIITQNEYDFWKIGTFSSQIAFQYILDTIFSIMYSQDYQKNLVNLKNKYELLKRGAFAGENPADKDQLHE